VAATEAWERPPGRDSRGNRIHRSLAAAILLALAPGVPAVTLPEDRADVLYHGYSGGGLEVNGPSVLVRKAYADKVSLWGNYYVDMISSASIDVVSTASEYDETRVEHSVGADYLHDRTLMGISWTSSEEDDYSSDLVNIGISQTFFGDLTTLGISYGRGQDEVRRNGDAAFAEDTDRQRFRVDLSQILTQSLVVSLNYEGVTDDGFLNNPYRQVRFLDPDAARGFSYEPELYPGTRTSNAVAARAMYYLPWRAAVRGEFRRYSDTWDLEAWNFEAGYVHPLPHGLTADVRYRYYDQTAAEFYSDLFSASEAQNFRARDKELATFVSHTLGGGVTYAFQAGFLPIVTRGEASLYLDWMQFEYDDFRDVRAAGSSPGMEPLYEFDAWVVRAFISFWF
jgi:hypothetical protein